MNLEEKLRQLQELCKKSEQEMSLERELQHLHRLDPISKPLGTQRVGRRIEEYVEGRVEHRNEGAFFLAEQDLPFGRPYGKMRIGDLAASVLAPLDLFLKGASLPDPSRLVFLDTETTGLIGSGDVCAFMIGLGTAEGTGFVVRQFFLRDSCEEKAALAALAEALDAREGLVTFNGKTFDVPLLETRYALWRLPSPFSRLIHLDLLHPARQIWKLRLGSCHLTHLETEILGISRDGDVPGSEIPGIYFDYLRTGDPCGLEAVFFHNALDIISLAALAAEIAGLISDARGDSQLLSSRAAFDLFSLSRIFARAGTTELSISAGKRAVTAGLPELVELRALWHLAAQYKLRGEYEAATGLWLDLARRSVRHSVDAYRELAVHYERRIGNPEMALEFTELALGVLSAHSPSADAGRHSRHLENFTRRRLRLQKRLGPRRATQPKIGSIPSLTSPHEPAATPSSDPSLYQFRQR